MMSADLARRLPVGLLSALLVAGQLGGGERREARVTVDRADRQAADLLTERRAAKAPAHSEPAAADDAPAKRAIVGDAGRVEREKPKPRRSTRHPKLGAALSLKARHDYHRKAEMVDVIVSYDRKPGSVERALTASLGGKDRRSYRNLPFRAVRIPAGKLEALANDGRVRFVASDALLQTSSPPARQTARVPGSTYQLNTPNKNYKGSGVTVAVVDSGVYEHGDFYNTLLAQYDFTGGNQGVQTPFSDPFGHGTHIAGMLGADGFYSSGYQYQGAATRAQVLSLRVLDDQGRGSVSNLLAALDWILDVGIPTYGIRVVNLSLGKGVEEEQALDPLVQAVNAVWDAGVVVVVSAGNYGQSGHYTITSPGNSRKVITVGSLTDNGSGKYFLDDTASTFSSRGPTLLDHVLKPDLLAPGNKVISPFAEYSAIANLVPPGRIRCGGGGGPCNQRYLELSGTSMSAALTSGSVARMLAKDPTLNPATVKARLMKSARKMIGDPTVIGTGVLDVEAAMNASGILSGQALSPKLELSSDGNRVYVEDTADLWGGAWPASTLWSNGTLWSDGYLAADGYVWSDANLWSNSYLWSNSVLWSNGSLWADSNLWSNAYIWANGILWSNFAVPFSTGGEDASDPAEPAEDVVEQTR